MDFVRTAAVGRHCGWFWIAGEQDDPVCLDERIEHKGASSLPLAIEVVSHDADGLYASVTLLTQIVLEFFQMTGDATQIIELPLPNWAIIRLDFGLLLRSGPIIRTGLIVLRSGLIVLRVA